jgi:four helix bundle protein
LVDDKDSGVQGFKDSGEMLKNYKELKVWQKSYQLCLEIYRIPARFPKDEKFGLTSQIRRAVGYGRKTTADYIKSLYIAYGSNCELETQMMLSGDLDTIDSAILEDIMDEIYEVERMLKALIKSLENKHLNP